MIAKDTPSAEHIDYLTKLYNRKYCLNYANKLIEKQIKFAIFIIDLNKFKQVNDIYGHGVGDIVLAEVSRRFKDLQTEDIIFSRLGGDEFSAIYKTNDKDKINALGKSISKSLEENIVVSESEFTISASIGVSRFPKDSDKLTELLKFADMAMYHSKKYNDTDTHLISDELSNKLRERKKMENLLRDIDIDNNLFLEYQPIFDSEEDKVISVEALVRWKHQKLGVIYPLTFIPIAEEIDIVKNITKWTFITALNQIKTWNETYHKNLKISINVSNNCIHNKIFFGNLQYMIETFKIDPSWLQLELTEFSLSVSPLYMKKLLVSLNELGIEIQLDDFGTSPIMLAALKEFKVGTIKIDNQYINALENEDNLNFVKGITMLAHQLDIAVLAEGVESKEQYDIIKTANIDGFQGFYKEKPLSASDFEKKYLQSVDN